jgi:hypothetical protein
MKLQQIGTSNAKTTTALNLINDKLNYKTRNFIWLIKKFLFNIKIRPAMMQVALIEIAVTTPNKSAMNPRMTAAPLISHLNHHVIPSAD